MRKILYVGLVCLSTIMNIPKMIAGECNICNETTISCKSLQLEFQKIYTQKEFPSLFSQSNNTNDTIMYSWRVNVRQKIQNNRIFLDLQDVSYQTNDINQVLLKNVASEKIKYFVTRIFEEFVPELIMNNIHSNVLNVHDSDSLEIQIYNDYNVDAKSENEFVFSKCADKKCVFLVYFINKIYCKIGNPQYVLHYNRDYKDEVSKACDENRVRLHNKINFYINPEDKE